MQLKQSTIVVCAALTACAGVQQTRQIPVSWAQTQEELGKLPVGRVLAVEKKTFMRSSRSGASTSAAVAGAAGPLVAVAVMPLLSGLRDGDWYYSHSIKLKGSSEMVVREEFAAYKLGDCVALRVEPFMLVPAFVGACD